MNSTSLRVVVHRWPAVPTQTNTEALTTMLVSASSFTATGHYRLVYFQIYYYFIIPIKTHQELYKVISRSGLFMPFKSCITDNCIQMINEYVWKQTFKSIGVMLDH